MMYCTVMNCLDHALLQEHHGPPENVAILGAGKPRHGGRLLSHRHRHHQPGRPRSVHTSSPQAVLLYMQMITNAHICTQGTL